MDTKTIMDIKLRKYNIRSPEDSPYCQLETKIIFSHSHDEVMERYRSSEWSSAMKRQVNDCLEDCMKGFVDFLDKDIFSQANGELKILFTTTDVNDIGKKVHAMVAFMYNRVIYAEVHNAPAVVGKNDLDPNQKGPWVVSMNIEFFWDGEHSYEELVSDLLDRLESKYVVAWNVEKMDHGDKAVVEALLQSQNGQLKAFWKEYQHFALIHGAVRNTSSSSSTMMMECRRCNKKLLL